MAMVCICVHHYLGAILPHPQAGIQHGLVMLLNPITYTDTVTGRKVMSCLFGHNLNIGETPDDDCVVTIPANDEVPVESGIWTIQEFEKRFKQ